MEPQSVPTRQPRTEDSSSSEGQDGNYSAANNLTNPNTCYGTCFAVSASDLAAATRPYETVRDSVLNDSNAAAREVYDYSPITAWQFRVLELLPAGRHAALEGRLIPASIAMQVGRPMVVSTASHGNTIMHFRALSYTWGSSEQDHVLLLDGRCLHVTAILHAALTELRDEGASIYLWADAVCIDQHSPQEKSEQVANMLQIYQAAENVDVWLGEAQDGSDVAMTYLKRFAEVDVTELARHHTQDCIEHAHRHLWPAVLELCSRPWLRRTWIRQEVYAAKSLTVHCGSCTVPWSAYLKGFSVLWLLTTWIPNIDQHIAARASAAIRLLQELHMNSTPAAALGLTKPPRNLVDVLATSQEYEVTQQCDQVFAVLGMCGARISGGIGSLSTKDPSITIDYDKDISEVWSEVTHYVFAEAALQEPSLDDVRDVIRQNEIMRTEDETYEDLEVESGHALSRLSSHVADVLNLSNSTHSWSAESAVRISIRACKPPAWTLGSLVSRSADEVASLRSLQLSRGKETPLRWLPNEWSFVIPSPRPFGTSALQTRGLLYGFVAGLMDSTCDTDDFVAAVKSWEANMLFTQTRHIYEGIWAFETRLRELIGPLWNSTTHSQDVELEQELREELRVKQLTLRTIEGPLPIQYIKTRPLSTTKNHLKLGFITIFDDQSPQKMLPQAALLPAESQPGDLVTCVAQNVLPLIIRPICEGFPQMLTNLHNWMREFGGFRDHDYYLDDQWLCYRDHAPESKSISELGQRSGDDWEKVRASEWQRVRARFWDQVPQDHMLLGSALFHLWKGEPCKNLRDWKTLLLR